MPTTAPTPCFARSVRQSCLLAVVGSSAVLFACDSSGVAGKNSASARPAQAEQMRTVLATIGDVEITMEDIRTRSGGDLDRAEMKYAQFRSTLIETTLNSLVRERVIDAEARRQKKTYEELVAAEAGAGVVEPTDEETAQWYRENLPRTGGRPLAEIRSQIADLLRKEKYSVAEARLHARLNKQYKVALRFEPYRLSFDNAGSPALGNQNARVTVVEFSDFQCPFCNRFASTLKEISKKYGDEVRIVYRQFPIPSIHPFAVKAAEASLCANEQGMFWELHDAMFADQKKLAVTDLKATAVAVGLDKTRFDTCLDTGRHAARVEKDMNEGARAGVAGTPAIFINGVELRGGAVPFDDVARAIDQELLRTTAK